MFLEPKSDLIKMTLNITLYTPTLPKAASTLVCATITSKLDQCNFLYFGIYVSNLAKLRQVKGFALRTVLNLHLRSLVTHDIKDLY